MLTLDTNANKKGIEVVSDSLDDYLKGACVVIGQASPRNQVNKWAQEYIDTTSADIDFFRDNIEVSKKVIEDKEKELNNKVKGTAFIRKLDYALDASVRTQGNQKDGTLFVKDEKGGIPNTFAEIGYDFACNVVKLGCALGAVTLGASALDLTSPKNAALVAAPFLVVAGAKYLDIIGAAAISARTPKEQSEMAQYVDAKHSLVVIKQLKKELGIKKEPNEVQKLMAAGYGQPSGGLVQAAVNMKKVQR
ncbi:MAG: hypothetical protein MJ247_00435 [Alphaproteobacteria bacterium]|nr:hypothetical protein [Alphaproteobacteria bacterium]